MRESILDSRHWVTEDFKQRMTVQDWRRLLLSGNDRIIFRGRIRSLKAKRLGCGVVEVTKEPLSEE